MINFIKDNLKTENLYISQESFITIINKFKDKILKNREVFLEVYNIDIKNCMQTTNLNSIIELLELYKKEKIKKELKREILYASYYGNPYITINLCMQSIINNNGIILAIEDSMVGINKILVDVFNSILEEYKIKPLVKLFNLVSKEEISTIQEHVKNVICIGNTNTYYSLLKYGTKNLKFIPFKNMAIYCNESSYKNILMELYNYSNQNAIEVEIYEDSEEEFVECVNLIDEIDTIVILSKDEESIEKIRNDIKGKKIYINKNPYKDEKFKLEM